MFHGKTDWSKFKGESSLGICTVKMFKINLVQYFKLRFDLRIILIICNRILHEWSFHMKFIKRAFGEFHKLHMK